MCEGRARAMILNIFSFFDDFEPGDFYKNNSYKRQAQMIKGVIP